MENYPFDFNNLTVCIFRVMSTNVVEWGEVHVSTLCGWVGDCQ